MLFAFINNPLCCKKWAFFFNSRQENKMRFFFFNLTTVKLGFFLSFKNIEKMKYWWRVPTYQLIPTKAHLQLLKFWRLKNGPSLLFSTIQQKRSVIWTSLFFYSAEDTSYVITASSCLWQMMEVSGSLQMFTRCPITYPLIFFSLRPATLPGAVWQTAASRG